ncbi:MAG: prohibitin family protein [Burkholderiales bacterium]|nr:prohibitin family protein [Burkholderiales bacterium]
MSLASGFSRDGNPNLLRNAVIGVLVLIVLVAFWPIRTVPTGSRGVVTVGGAIRGLQNEGFTVILPWQKLDVFSIRAEQADIENAEGSTSDTQPVKVSLTVRYSIAPDRVTEVYEKYSHDGNLQSYVQTATQEVFKAVTARYSAPDLIAQRAAVSSDITGALRAKLANYGAQVISIDMRNFSFSESYMRAINDKVTQEQLRLAAENKLKTVEAEQKQKVAVAEAEANAVKATADGDAYAKLKVAQAEAQAMQAGAAPHRGRAHEGAEVERPAAAGDLRRRAGALHERRQPGQVSDGAAALIGECRSRLSANTCRSRASGFG